MNAVEVKICGLARAEDARSALELGADYLGFVLYPKSPRGISGLELARIRDQLPAAARCVAVFVNVQPREVARIAADCALHAAQIHGDERAADFADIGIPLWRALQVKDGQCRPRPEAWPAERYVVDAAPAGRYGGSGETADWEEASRLASRHPVMLAGGLTPGNVCDAIRKVRPVGVDVSSGIEASPGVKDLDNMRLFLERARLPDAREET